MGKLMHKGQRTCGVVGGGGDAGCSGRKSAYRVLIKIA